jgi:hypothetical protein
MVQRQPAWQQTARRSAWYEKGAADLCRCASASTSRPLAAVRFLAVGGRHREAKICPCVSRVLRRTARLRRLKMAKLELSGRASPC